MKLRAPVVLVLLLAGSSSVRGESPLTEARPASGPPDLSALTIEELMNIEVTSVSRKGEKATEAPAAIFVITREDIRRSGYQSLPEILRLAPGLDVARIDANKWAITARGFNGRYAKKLLVLIDGRSVYTPIFSGVFWDTIDVPPEDIERIEVIRGPGSTQWGENAVNGVINIITRHSRDTQGELITVGGGSEDLGFARVRHGGSVGQDLQFRVYGNIHQYDDFPVAVGSGDNADEWRMLSAGFRVDWSPSARDQFAFIGDLMGGEVGTRTPVPTTAPPFQSTFNDRDRVVEADLLGRWTHDFQEGSQSILQVYYDRAQRRQRVLEFSIDTFDIDFQHRLRPFARQEVIWGLGYRAVLDHIQDGISVSAHPSSDDHHLLSAFLQDEITLVRDLLRFTVGTKVEYNDRTGFEFEPSGRLLLTPHERHTIWAAVSRAVRTPSRSEETFQIDVQGAPGLLTTANGSPTVEAEGLLALELGYRVHPWDRLSLDFAGFYNLYDHLVGLRPGAPFVQTDPPPAHLELPLTFANQLSGETYGLEIAGNLKVAPWWMLYGSYSFLAMQIHASQSTVTTEAETEGASPRNQAQIRSSFSLPWNLELDLHLSYVDHLGYYAIPSYVRLDARVGWHPTRRLELSAGVQNLLDSRHPEFGAEVLTTPSELERAYFGMVTWRF